MPHTERARCLFTVIPQTSAKPAVFAMIHFEFIDKTPSALERPPRRVFFSLKEGVGWQQAEELAVQLNRTVATMNFTEYALGEYERDIF
jgi:hypothetical protein